MLEGDWLRSTLDGDEGDMRLVSGRGRHRLDWRAGASELDDRSSSCSNGLGARLFNLFQVSVPSAALLLLLGAGIASAQDAQDTLPTVSVSDVQAYEDDRWIDFAVSLSHPSSEQVTVEFATSSGTATMGTDFRGGSQTLIFPPNRKDPRRVSVMLYDDLETEPDETFTVALTNPTGATLGDATATGTIRNDDTAATLTASDIEDTTATLTISGHTDGWWYRRDEWLGNVHPCTAVTAGTTAVSIGGLTAARRYEYTAFSDSTCATRLARVTFWTLAPEGTPTVNISDAEASEDGTWMHFRVLLSQVSREPVTVDVHTSSGTATSGTDFSANSETLTFPANSRGRAFSVIVRDDQEPEPDETFTVTLTNPTNATLGDATATGTIKDDGDTAVTLTPSDIEDTTATLTIGGHTDRWWYRGRSSGTSSPWGVCTAVTAGTTAVGITGLKAMTTYEYWAYSDSGCSTKLANVKFGTLAPVGTPTVSISDAEASEDGKWIRFEVSLSQPSREEVRVRYETLSGTATSGTDFQGKSGLRAGSVIFDANRPQITRHARVKVFDDQKPEPDETLTVRLISARGATLGDVTATGTIKDDDTGATLAASNIEDTTATLTISDHSESWWYRGRSSGTSSPWGGCTAVSAGTTVIGLSGLSALTTYEYRAFSDSACSTKLARLEFQTIAPEGTPTVSVSDAQVSEDNSWIRFNVSLSHPSREPVTVWFETSSGTATSGTDFDARPGHVSFSANSLETTSYASVIVHDDEETEPDETFTLTLTRASNATLGDATTATGTIKDNDTGATLAASNIEDTTATLTIADHTDGWWYKGNAHSCMAVAAGTTAVGIDGLTAVTDYEYSAYSDSGCSTKLARVAFRTLATEGVTPTVSVSDAEVSEDGGRMQFWVSLSEPSREEVTVDVQTSDGTATSGTDYRAESVTLTFPANSRERQLLPVPVHDDRDPEPDETFTVTLSNPTGATLGDATATGTITDDGDTGAAGVALVSDPGDDATYAAGDAVRVAVTFSEAVAVDTADGTPRLKLDLGGDDGTGERWAAYEDGSGTETLTFAWTAAAADESAVGVAVLADTLDLNGGTIRSAATQADVALGHSGADHDPAHKVDAVVPLLVRGEIDGGTMQLYFSEALDPDSTGGDFLMGVETPDRGVMGFDAAGGVTVEGAVVTVGLRLDLGYPGATPGLNRNSVSYWRRTDGSDGALRDPAGNLVAAPGKSRTTDGVAMRYFRTDLANVTGPVTSVTGVAVISDAGSDDTYVLGDTIRVQVTFNETVEVTGSPRLKIDMDPAHWGEKWAAYESGTGTGSLTFAHTVVQPNYSTQGIAVLANTLQLNGGTIRSDGADADLAHDGRPHDANHKVDWRTQPESGGEDPAGQGGDGGPPTVTGVAVVSSPASGSTYMLGETIRIRATFSEQVTVTGSPGLSIDMDPAHWGTKRASYASGGGTSSLDFVHTVVEPNYSTQGIAVLANSLALNGGAIRSAATNANAALGHTGLGHNSGHKVDWRPSISVADARANEGAGAAVAFVVSLNRAFTTVAHRVTVAYATTDGTAKAGEDYTSTSGTLTFAAGESSKTVNVPVLDDSIDEGEETFTLRLSNATGARIGDGEATGTIANDDPLQKMWLSRFGRTVASDAIATVTARLQTPRDAGSHLTLAGQRLSLDGSSDGRMLADVPTGFAHAFGALPPPADPGDPFAGHGLTGAWNDPLASAPARRVTGRELLLGTSFRAVLASDAGTQLTSWGQGASVSRFSGAVPGLSLSGETASGALGMDYERGRLLTGFAMMHSVGEGTAHDEGLRYAMGSTVTTLLPYARYALTDRLSAWGLAGTGTGSLALGLDTGVSPRQRTDLSLTLAATGVRGELLSPAEAGGFALALKADAFWVRTESDAVSAPGVGNLAAARGESSRVRAVLDGSRTFAFAGGATLTPSVELGVRHDGGDAETGTGVELGAGLGYADPSRGLDMALRVHGLSAHAGDGYSELGVSGSLRLVPGAAGRGLSASLTPSYGVDPGGSHRLWMLPDASGLAANDDAVPSSRLDAEVGYGLAVFGGSFTGTPHVGFGLSEAGRDWRVGWRLTSGGGSLDLSLEAIRREPDNSTRAGYGAGTEPEHMVGVQVGARF